MLQRRKALWIPLVVWILTTSIFISLSVLSQRYQDRLLQTRTDVTAEQVALRLDEYINTRLNLVGRMQLSWRQGLINSPEDFRLQATDLISQFSGLQAINWIDREGFIRWIVPEDANLAAKDKDLKKHPQAAQTFLNAMRTGKIQVTPPVMLLQGGHGFAAYFPLEVQGERQGYLNAVFRLDPLIEGCLAHGIQQQFSFVIRDGEDLAFLAGKEDEIWHSRFRSTYEFKVGNRLWNITLAPNERLGTASSSFMNHLPLPFGLLLGLGLALFLRRLIIRESQLAISEERYRTIFENAPMGLFRIDQAGRLLAANQAMAKTYGFDSVADFVAQEYIFKHWESPEVFAAMIREVELRGEVQGFETAFRDRDGRQLWVRHSGRWFADKGYLEGVGYAVTEEKLALEALRRSETRFRRLMEGTRAMIFIIGAQHRILYANQAAQDYTGYTADELLGQTSRDIIAAAQHEILDRAIAAYQRDNTPLNLELIFNTKDGRERWFETAGIIIDFDNQPAWLTTSFEITERKRAEEELRRSEDKFRTIFENAQVGLFRIAKSRLEDANLAMARMFGYQNADEFVAQYDMANCFYDPQDGTRMAEEIRVTGGLKRFEARLYRRDRSYIWVRFSSTYYPDKDMSEGVIIDITDEKNAVDALMKSERKFRTLADSTRAIILINDQAGNTLYANQAAAEKFGYDETELTRMKLEDLLTPRAKQILAAAGLSASSGNLPVKLEYPIRAKDGREIWLETTSARIELDEGDAWISTAFDVTDRRLAEEALRESENKYRTMFQTTGTLTMSFDQDAIIRLANEEFPKLTGYSIEEAVGKMSWMQLFDEKSLEKMRTYHAMRAVNPQAVPRSYEARLVDKAGRFHDGIVTINLVPGTTVRVASFLDITERKQAELQMLRADKMAALGQIIAGVAHEINNPNNFIYFNLPILRRYVEAMRPLLDHHRDEDPDLKILNMPYETFLEDVYKLIENMEHGSQRITGIVSELKNYIRSHEVEDRKQENLQTIINQVMTLVGKQVRKMVKRFEIEVAPETPDVWVNAGKIEQVLINLTINAGQAADKEDSWVKLTARPAPDRPNWVEITVQDNGCGMPEYIQHQIFDPFFTTKGRDSGTGLGLAISQRIVEEHGGKISVTSEVGKGSCFTLRLPVKREE
ncbi:MAG: PAS domain S-box protein [Myxococcales bacterium]|nr:PAS domain S-box protein [Myxococcales bacterium]